MKINFNWGHGITLFYIVFVGILITVVIASRGVDYNLVYEDYYAHDIAYQEHYDKISNDLKSAHPVKMIHDKKSKSLKVIFEKGQVISNGVISFYRPSDKNNDFKETFNNVTDSQLLISTDKLLPGRWKVMLDWKQGEKAFYKEIEIRV